MSLGDAWEECCKEKLIKQFNYSRLIFCSYASAMPFFNFITNHSNNEISIIFTLRNDILFVFIRNSL